MTPAPCTYQRIIQVAGTVTIAVGRISARTGQPMSRLPMPMGFRTMLGDTITMIGSSPLIPSNGLILTSNKALPPGQQMEAWSPFSVIPIGIAYFVLPTPQANALIMGPAGYRVADFMKAGGIMTVLFLTILTVMLRLIY